MNTLYYLSIITTVLANCNILSLSGGGSFGAVEVGILDNLISKNSIPTKYDLVTGISVGGLNAGLLSYFDNITSALPIMKNTYFNIQTNNVYISDILGIFTEWSIYSTKPLETTLINILESITASENSQKVLLGAVNLLTQKLDIFEFNNLSFDDKINALMSTSAIPIAFPPRKFNNTIYVDGGVISNEIINQAIGYLNCSYSNITFISAHPKTKNNNITGLVSYVEALIHTLLNSFDNQLSQSVKCIYPKGQINACFPTSPQLNNYSIFDFDNGLALYQLGKDNNTCIQYQLC